MIQSAVGPGRDRLPGWRAGAGLTLVELVVVLAMLGLLAALAVPRLMHSDLDELRRMDELRETLVTARDRAVASACDLRVGVSGAGASFSQRSAGCTGGFGQPVPGLEPGDSLPGAGLGLTSSAAVFYFDARGRVLLSPGGSPADVMLQAGGRTLRLIGETGHVRAE